MLNITLYLGEFTITIEDGLFTKTTKNGLVTSDTDERNQAYDLFHNMYDSKQVFIDRFHRYCSITSKLISTYE